ncbi:MAG: UDP-N-acetylmuramate dehydrogenase [Anaerolineales bacterium]|nr:UDP-N-acetylmuramate dehydrogenase [Anaerolineales bacterium]
MKTALPNTDLRAIFGKQLQENVSLAAYTSARIGGQADLLVTVKSADELAKTVQTLWSMERPFCIVGGGSNILVSDKGVREVVILNRAKKVTFNTNDQLSVTAESGVIFSNLANRAAGKGFSGLEWAAAIPGTIGGAVYGNAGAFGGDMAGSLIWTELLTMNGRERWPVEKMEYDYRTSLFKRTRTSAVVLSACLRLENGHPGQIKAHMQEIIERRRSTQPPGASMGSMFKNPPGEHAGRLIEAAGLKGTRIGNAEISQVHANFFINHGETKASDIRELILLVQKCVEAGCGIKLELEIELIGEWS